MAVALTRGVSENLNKCLLEFLDRAPIDPVLAAAQHREYERMLASLGVRVITLPAEPDLPDSVFVEDPALVLDEVAVICRPGAVSRRPEAVSLAKALKEFRNLLYIQEPATIEGGDIMRIGRNLYVGLSRRTNLEGIRQLADLTAPYGYTVIAVPVLGSLHLKSAICSLGDGAVLANREWIDATHFSNYDVIDVAEPWSANVLRVADTVIMPDSFPQTRALLESRGYRIATVDVSELQKAESGVTCSSLIFEG